MISKPLFPTPADEHHPRRPVLAAFVAGVSWLGCAASALAGVDVDFSHSNTAAPGAYQNTGSITLAFTVDGSGDVVLDASCPDPDPAAFVNEFDGPVGTVTDPAMWGQSFTIVLSSTGSGNLRIDNTGGGLSVQGGNAQLIDANNSGVNEEITATVTAGPGQFALQRVGYVGRAGSADMDVDGITYPLSTSSGAVDVSAQGIADTFTVASSASAVGQGFVLSGLAFSIAAGSGDPEFDNGGGDNLWTNATNWNPDGLPVAPDDAVIDGHDVIVDIAVASGPAQLQLLDGSLTIRGSGSLPVASMSIGEVLESEVRLLLEGSTASLSHTGSGVFTVGSSATVETTPDNGGSSPLELDNGELVLEIGYEWILDGSDYTGSFTVGDRFVLANFGTLTGPGFGSGSGSEDGFTDTAGFRTRNFDLPPDRGLHLVQTATSIYYEVVARTAATGPNIIIINVDDMAGGQHFNFEGRDCLTPTLDSLASNGLRFTEGFAASTVCGPSRYALMTGRWASRNTSAQFIARYPLGTLGRFGVADTELESDNQNLGAWLQQAGYRTGMVGKGHFTDDDLNQTANWAAKGLMTYPKTADPRTDAATNAKMKHNHRVLCQRMRAFGFDHVSSYYKANLAELRNDKLNVHNQEWITKGALDFIEENHDQRFFLYMAPTVNHGPVRNDLTKTLLADKGYTSAGYLPNEDYSFMPTRAAIVNEVLGASKEQISARETWIDYSIAAIINKLTAHGIRDDTLIIFTSDHGEKDLNSTRAGHGPVIWGKSSLFDLGMRVPLVMNWPDGITSPGRTYDEIVSHVELAPTLLALTGASGLPTRPVDGVSLVPVFNGSSAAVRQDLFAEIGYARAVRTRDHKYVAVRFTPDVYAQIDSGYLWERFQPPNWTGEFTEPRPYYVKNAQLGSLAAGSNPTYFDDDQLYHLSADPGEDSNLYGTDPATGYDLKKRLANYIGDIPDRPFRQFGDGSTEFSPAPAAAPSPPGNVQLQFQGVNQVQLDWTDAADDELGHVVRKSVNGGPFEIIDEKPSGVTTSTVLIDAGVEDIVIEVASYNALGNTGVSEDLLAPESWRFRTFGDVDPTLSLPISQWSNDADGDGEINLWEYAFATNPRLASSVARPAVRIAAVELDFFLELLVPRDARRPVQIDGAVSENLSLWSSGEPGCVVAEDEPNLLLFRSATPVSDHDRQFIRAEIDEP